MSTYIRITEIWVPTEDRKELRYLDGLYGPHDEFRALSQQTRFRYDEGLPGQAWAARHPIILKHRGYGLPGRVWKSGLPLIVKDLQDSKVFLRWQGALENGINKGVFCKSSG
jgi:hypothetical protein